jgi:hypothetical protein
MACTLQQYNSWMMDLERAHISQPQTLHDDKTKVIHALDHVEKECRNRWDTHMKSLRKGDESVFDYYKWDEFKTFSSNFKKDPQGVSGVIQSSINAAYQRENQDPWTFHQYLETLELEQEMRSDSSRAEFFLSRLLGWISLEIRTKYALSMPETRDKMVRVAQAIWVSTPERVRKRKHEEVGPKRGGTGETPNKRGRGGSSSGGVTNMRGGTLNNPRKRGQGRGRGSRARGSYTQPNQNAQGSTSEATPKLNPPDETGKTTTCYRCGSTYHYAPDCPVPAEAAASVNQVRGRGNYRSRGYRGQNRGRGGRGTSQPPTGTVSEVKEKDQ